LGKKYSRFARESSVAATPAAATSPSPASPGQSPFRRPSQEDREAEEVIAEQYSADQTMQTITELAGVGDKDKELMPPPKSNAAPTCPVAGLGLKDTLQDYLVGGPDAVRKPDFVPPEDEDGELDLTGIDDDEINGYLMSEAEVTLKTKMWDEMNADWIKAKAEKEERERQEEKEAAKEGREVKKRTRKTTSAKDKKKGGPGNANAIEAIEKIAQEKKISTKINYDVLKNLTLPGSSAKQERDLPPPSPAPSYESGTGPASPRKSIFSPAAGSTSPRKSFSLSDKDLPVASGGTRKRLASFKSPPGSPVKKAPMVQDTREVVVESGPVVRGPQEEDDHEDDYDDDDLEDEDESDLGKMLSQHRGDDGGDDDAYIEEEYY